MKKALSLILALVLCLSLYACGKDVSKDISDTADNKENSTTLATDGTGDGNANSDIDWFISGTQINTAKLPEYVEIVELTTENWMEHFKVYSYSYTEENIEKDAFGEIVSTEPITHEGRAFGAGNEKYHYYDDVVIELKHKTTGELFIFDLEDGQGGHNPGNDLEVEEDFTLDDYECTRIKGSVYYLKLSIGELPVSTIIWKYTEDPTEIPTGMRIYPGTNAINGSLKEWLS